MDGQRLGLYLLPGMDGTGKLFSDFAKLLPGWIEAHVVEYPRDQKLSYDQLLPILRSAIQPTGPFVVLAESFSTPLAVRFAAEHPAALQALVLCAGFVAPPVRGLLAATGLALAPILFALGLPESACRRFLVGHEAQKNLVATLRSTVASVSAEVLSHRLRSILVCSAEHELQEVSVPLLCISGAEDRLIRQTSFQTIRRAKPDARNAVIQAPHLVLQVKPRESIDVLVTFLQQIGIQPILH